MYTGRLTMRMFLFMFLLLYKTAYSSNICILIDHQRSISNGNYAIYYELEKIMHTDADHIFVPPALWSLFSKYQANKQRKQLLKQWLFYDTKIGLIYIKAKRISKKSGIKTKKFKLLKKPFTKKIPEKPWITLFPNLFNIEQWQTHRRQTKKPSIVYMDGHGSKRKKDPSAESICGIPAYKFARLLHFFHTELNICLLGVQTCHWPSTRIFELIVKQYKYKAAPFGIITPLRTEDTLSTPPFKRQSQEYCFLKALELIMHNYDGKATPQMKKIACRIDTLNHPKNNNQGVTFVPTGDMFTHVL